MEKREALIFVDQYFHPSPAAISQLTSTLFRHLSQYFLVNVVTSQSSYKGLKSEGLKARTELCFHVCTIDLNVK